MKGHTPRKPPCTAPRPLAGPKALNGAPGDTRPFWQDLALACAPAVLGALVSGVCSMVSEALAHRRERDDGKGDNRKRMN